MAKKNIIEQVSFKNTIRDVELHAWLVQMFEENGNKSNFIKSELWKSYQLWLKDLNKESE